MLARLLPALLLLPLTCALGETKVDTFEVSATIARGCMLGSGTGSTAQLGQIDFGTMSSLSSQVDVSSAIGSGTIVVSCTPGISITLALGNGLHNTGNQRYLKHTGGTSRLAYGLYQSSDYSTHWGSETQARTIAAFPDSTQAYTVFARLYASGSTPPAGIYTDTVTVTLTY